MPHLEPTYLRYIYDGLIKGGIHPENAAELPAGLIGMYEEAFDERTSVVERQKLLQRFAIWALLKKEVSAAFVAEVLGETEDDIQEFISTYSAWFNSPESGKYQLYHERLKVYLLQKMSEGEIFTMLKLIIDKIETNPIDEFRNYYLRVCSTYYLILSISLKSKEKTKYRTKLFNMALDHAICDELTELDSNFSNLNILNDALNVELYFYNEGKTESLYKILESFGNVHHIRTEKYIQKIDALNSLIRSDFQDLWLYCLDNVNVISSQKLRFLLLSKLISHAILHKFDLKPFTDDLIAAFGNVSSLNFELSIKDAVNSIIRYGIEINLAEATLLDHLIGNKSEAEIAEMSNSAILFNEMASYNKKKQLEQQDINDSFILELSQIIDLEITKNRIETDLSIDFLEIALNLDSDFLLHAHLKNAFKKALDHSPEKVFDFLRNLCENYRFDDLGILLDKLPLFDNINKISVLLKLYNHFQLSEFILNEIKTILIKYIDQWIAYLTVDNTLEINKSIIEYVSNKIDRFDLSYHSAASQKIINQLFSFCRENNIKEYDPLFLKLSNSQQKSVAMQVSNCYQIKAMLSKCGISYSQRQLLRINLIDFYEYGIRIMNEEIQEDFYNAIDFSIKKSSRNTYNSQTISNNYWNIIAQIESIQTNHLYRKYFKQIHINVGKLKFETEQTDKKSELYLELLCLAKRNHSEQDFIAVFDDILNLKNVTFRYLKCACSLIFFYKPLFFNTLIKHSVFSLELKNMIKQRMFLAYLENHKSIKKNEKKFVYKLISTNSALIDSYLSL